MAIRHKYLKQLENKLTSEHLISKDSLEMIRCKKRARNRETQLSREEVKSDIISMFNITTNKGNTN